MVVKLFHGVFGLLFRGKGDKCVTSIVAIEIHHHPYFINVAKLQKTCKHDHFILLQVKVLFD